MTQDKKQSGKRKWSVPKGQYGYLAWGRQFSMLRTVLYFSLSAAIFIMGWISTGNKMNLLTIVAVLGVLPASKSAVNMVMYFRNRGCSAAAYEQITAKEGGLTVLYDLAMTTYDKTYKIASLSLQGHTICGYTEDPDCDENAAQKHIENSLKMDGHKEYTVKIFHDLAKYTTRMEQMNQLEDEDGGKQYSAVTDTLLSISL